MSVLATPSRWTRGAGPWESARRERLGKECVVIMGASLLLGRSSVTGAAGCLGVRPAPPWALNLRRPPGRGEARRAPVRGGGAARGVSGGSERQAGHGARGLADHGDAMGAIHRAAGAAVRRIEHESNIAAGKA